LYKPETYSNAATGRGANCKKAINLLINFFTEQSLVGKIKVMGNQENEVFSESLEFLFKDFIQRESWKNSF